MTTTEAVAQFLTDLANDRRSPHTVNAYQRDLDTFTRLTGRIPIDTVTPALLTSFMALSLLRAKEQETR